MSKTKRPKIYCLLTTVKALRTSSGDTINEILLLKCFSTFADVYYNNQLFRPKKKNFGLKEMRIKAPSRKYDLCYVRGNATIFNKCPKPKIWMAVPYEKGIFARAAAVVTLTETWKNAILEQNKTLIKSIYQRGFSVPKRIITLPQAYSPVFQPYQNHARTLELRKKIGGDFIIGNFGRIVKSCYPFSFFHIIPQILEKYKDKNIKIIFAGNTEFIKNKKNFPFISFLPHIRHEDVPFYISACDMVTSNQRHDQSHFCGSRQILEAMACGTPVLTGDFKVRKEQLGENYPLFWKHRTNKGREPEEAEEQMIAHISKIIEDPEFKDQVSQHLISRSHLFSMGAISKKIETTIKGLLRT